jgi:hypothetical protein
MSESSSQSEKKATDDNTHPAEQPAPKKLTPLEKIKQAQAARQQNFSGGGKRGGSKGQSAGQGGAAASRKPTTGRQSYGGNS